MFCEEIKIHWLLLKNVQWSLVVILLGLLFYYADDDLGYKILHFRQGLKLFFKWMKKVFYNPYLLFLNSKTFHAILE
jgi:hypothetical protein